MELSCADHIYGFKIHDHAYLDIGIERIGAVYDFFPDAFSFPLIPVGDMGIFGITVCGLHLTELVEFVDLAA